MITNIQIARRMVIDKLKLVELLSQFPVTALWLLHHYEQSDGCCNAMEDDENDFSGESAEALAYIKKQFFSVYRQGEVDSMATVSTSNLATALQSFAYSFHDLTGLVDVIVYICVKMHGPNASKEQQKIYNRRRGIQTKAEDRCLQFLESLKAILGEPYFESSLLPKDADLIGILADVVKIEALWLHDRERLTTANARLVRFIANQYKGGFLDFDDLVQEGQTGLLKAVDRFNYRLGYKFSTYAGYWIRQAISRALSRNERVVRIPCGQVGVINKVYRAKEQLVCQIGRDPKVQELAEFTGLTREEIDTVFAISQASVAIEDASDEETNVLSPIDFLEQQVYAHPFRDIAQADLESLIGKAIKLLNPREARIICGHFGVQIDREMTLKEIGCELNLTRERVRQIQVMALDKIRRFYGVQLAACL